MRKYYTRPCNFYYGNYAKKLIKNKRALPLAGNLNIAFNHLEIFTRKKNSTFSNIHTISEIKAFNNGRLLMDRSDKNWINKTESLKIQGQHFLNQTIVQCDTSNLLLFRVCGYFEV